MGAPYILHQILSALFLPNRNSNTYELHMPASRPKGPNLRGDDTSHLLNTQGSALRFVLACYLAARNVIGSQHLLWCTFLAMCWYRNDEMVS